MKFIYELWGLVIAGTLALMVLGVVLYIGGVR